MQTDTSFVPRQKVNSHHLNVSCAGLQHPLTTDIIEICKGGVLLPFTPRYGVASTQNTLHVCKPPLASNHGNSSLLV